MAFRRAPRPKDSIYNEQNLMRDLVVGIATLLQLLVPLLRHRLYKPLQA